MIYINILIQNQIVGILILFELMEKNQMIMHIEK